MITRDFVPAALAGERLDRVVSVMTGVSRAEAAALLGAGRVRLSGKVVEAGSRRVQEHQPVEVDLPERSAEPVVQPDDGVPVTVVYEDDHILVIDKPAGLVVHPGAGNPTGTLVHGLLARYPELAGVGEPARPGIVHRLDKDTSGLLVVARTQDAYERLVDLLAAHEVTREYVALVWGVPETRHGTIDAPIGRSERQPTRMAVARDGREARTHFRVRAVYHDPVEVALLDVTLETGRTHQIRVHLSSIGHPVVGDSAYRGDRARLRVPRPMLHAARIAFAHPADGRPMEFDSPMPADFTAVLAGLG